MRRSRNPMRILITWFKRQPPKVKSFLAVVAGIFALVFIRFVVQDHDNLFVAAEAIHSLGILVLIYKLTKEKTCTGLSLKSQELTALFLAVRLYCSVVMEYDIHTLLDTATLLTTAWVIYMIRYKLKSTYLSDLDNFPIYSMVVPCAVLALLIHPTTSHHLVNRVLWAFCVYLEAVSVVPQLRVMQNTKVVEPFTSHYVFALGVARFLSCAHWIIQIEKYCCGLPKELRNYCTKTKVTTLTQLIENASTRNVLLLGQSSGFGGSMKEDKLEKFSADQYVQNMDEMYQKVKHALERTWAKQKKAVDHHRRELLFSLGDWALLRFEKARLKKRKDKESLFTKLSMRYYGPFQVTEKINDVSYRLKLPDSRKIHNAFHVLDSRGFLLTALGHGLWPSMVLLSEVVQTFILADFCYYYVKSVVEGQSVMRLPSGVV